MKSKPMVRVKDSIATRLLFIVFSLYFIVTITVTLFHMYIEFFDQKNVIRKDKKMEKKKRREKRRDKKRRKKRARTTYAVFLKYCLCNSNITFSKLLCSVDLTASL